jgi:xanthine dehydrogenase molybdenum-binding subunit
MMEDLKYVGKGLVREDCYNKAKGKTKYICDMQRVGMLYAKLVLSKKAHANIYIDTTEAMKIEGIVEIYTHIDVPKIKYNSHNWYKGTECPEDQYILSEKARYVGDHIALVVGETKKAVEEAISLVRVEYKDLPAIIGIKEAVKEDKNLAFTKTIVCGDYEDRVCEADYVIKSKGSTPKIHHSALEPHIALSEIDETGNLVLWSPCQTVYQIQYHISQLLELPFSHVRVIKAVMGGSFGGKGQSVIEPACAFATHLLQRPVMLYMDREDAIMATRSRNACSIEVETAVTKEGKIIGRKIKSHIDGGAYYTNASAVAMALSKKLFRMYKIDNQICETSTYFTNTIPGGACRGYGSPQAHAITEVNIDIVAKRINMDPCEFRLKNIAQAMDEDPTGGTNLGNIQIESCIRKGMEKFNWHERRVNVKEKNTKRYSYGVGMACGAHGNGYKGAYPDFTNVNMVIFPDSSVMVKIGVHDQGCGTIMCMQQIAAEALRIDPYKIKIQEADTLFSPYDSAGTQASRVTYVCGRAVQKTAEMLRKKIIEACVLMYNWNKDKITMDEGIVTYEGAAISYGDIALDYEKRVSRSMSMNLEYETPTNPGSYACCFAEVKVDCYTGQTEIIDFLAVHDIGRAINIDSVEGQIAGGAQMSLGMALYEEIEIDEVGIVKSKNFSKYHIINAPSMPKINIALIEGNEPNGPYGGKSVGELAAVTPAPALVNAINNALNSELIDYPLTPEKIVCFINGREEYVE